MDGKSLAETCWDMARHKSCMTFVISRNLLGTEKDNVPKNVPMKKGVRGTLMTGEVMLMNQFGRNGVMRRKMM